MLLVATILGSTDIQHFRQSSTDHVELDLRDDTALIDQARQSQNAPPSTEVGGTIRQVKCA